MTVLAVTDASTSGRHLEISPLEDFCVSHRVFAEEDVSG